MKSMKIAAVINYCSNDDRFIQHTINQAAKFSQQIIVPYCDHFYDDSLENKTIINKTIKANPQVQFIAFPYDPQVTRSLWRGWQFILRRLKLGRVWGPQYWIGFARRLGFLAVNQNIDYVLFLDADEIVDAKKFLAWLKTDQYQSFTALKLAAYWYWRSPSYQADVWEDNPLLARRNCLDRAVFMDHDERNAIFKSISGEKIRLVLGLDRRPMIHHYGWAKPKKNLIKKVKTWGHNKDRNWVKLINQEFSHPFSGHDFLYPNRHYQVVKPFIK